MTPALTQPVGPVAPVCLPDAPLRVPEASVCPPDAPLRVPDAPVCLPDAILASYLDANGRRRELLTRRGSAGSMLVVDRDCSSRGDHRLIAHLLPDEPAANAVLVCRHYLHDPPRRRCRRLTAEDAMIVPFAEEEDELQAAAPAGVAELRDRHGWAYRLEPQTGGSLLPQLRWCRTRPGSQAPSPPAQSPRAMSVREVIGALESYRSVRTLTVAALVRHRGSQAVSVTRLRAELERANGSRIVLNRGLRSAVLEAGRCQGLSLSEIAVRCGRFKCDARGNVSGETSWLSRRVGLSPEGGRRVSTPWVHTDVLALIARRGLGLSPREVEVD